MRVLALDTATEACSVALFQDGELISRSAEGGRTHAQHVLSMVGEVLTEAGISLAMLDGIAAGIGPGAFTGVRISVSLAQGLAFGAGLKVVPVNSLEALALNAMSRPESRVLACLDARMGEVYWGCFARDPSRALVALSAGAVGPPSTVCLPEPGRYRGIGRGFAAYPLLAQLPGLVAEGMDIRALPNAREVARLGAGRLAMGAGLDPAELTPLYLRDKVALTEAERAAR